MTKQPTRRRRRARCPAARLIAVAGAAALVAVVGAGQALAATAPPDERILERQGMIDRQAADQGKAEAPARPAPDRAPGRLSKPEPKVNPGPWIDDEPAAPTPAPAGGLPDLVIPATAAVLILTIGVATTWWVRHRRPPPEPTT
jgi:hypothetical protein